MFRVTEEDRKWSHIRPRRYILTATASSHDWFFKRCSSIPKASPISKFYPATQSISPSKPNGQIPPPKLLRRRRQASHVLCRFHTNSNTTSDKVLPFFLHRCPRTKRSSSSPRFDFMETSGYSCLSFEFWNSLVK